MDKIDFNISIVGIGLIGGSYAMSLKELSLGKIYGIDIDEKALEDAETMGIIDKGYVSPEIPLKDSDLVIICLYPKSVKKFVMDNIDNFKTGAIITDVTGVKTKILDEINYGLREDLDFIFGHPMAGREEKGLKFSSKEVFKGANYIITPTNRNKCENIKLIEDIIKKIGFKNIMTVTPEEHDKIISFTSQLPHVIAVSLVNSNNLDFDIGLFTGDSYRELTRIAQINSELWTELFIENKINLIKDIEIFEENIKKFKEAIIKEDREMLIKSMDNARKRRKEMS
ncbi:prephenate dehydrogenase [Clostridium brassicae]|uniref:Prephenate dehydrogenase n=1 Tax=Clostridium brassicae TaxID=2999072 RepID=A0ABT4DA98_9CLOT|nr:prephenate dehydrogenase [Clostridium brassicae]MCY6959237.1 prephenate dehydrogenase [Clostridium brassicae]